MPKRRSSLTPTIRGLVQLAFGLFILAMSAAHALGENAGVPSIDALCPFGGLETLWSLLTKGTYCPKTHPSNVVLGIGLLVGTLLAGSAFCGWICPLGGLQDLLTVLRKWLRLGEIKVPPKVDAVLSYGRYVVLAGILYATASTAKLWFSGYDPYRTIFGLEWLFAPNLAEAWPAYLVAAVLLVGAFFVPRFWCRYLCPLGGVLSLVSRVSIFRIRRRPNVCIGCKKCDRLCPMRIKVSEKGSVTANCIGCLACVESCPVKGALEIGTIMERPVVAEPKEGAA